MLNLRTLALALPVAMLCATSAVAAPLQGDYLITITAGRGVPKGATTCLTLTPTGQVAGLANSGTVSIGGSIEGSYYVFQSQLTAIAANVLLTGRLYNHSITNTSLTVASNPGIAGIGAFTATPTTCTPAESAHKLFN